jgi:HSP20 family protein
MSQTLPARRGGSQSERWNQSRELDPFTERMQRLLEQTFGDVAPLLTEAAAWVPPVDIEEQDDAYVIEAELPGVKREEVNIELVGNELSISGDIKERERKGLLRRRTRKTGRFELRVALPDPVDAGSIDANLKSGVLTVRIPKTERAQRKQVEIKES